jgi:hypothetical protein
MEEYRHIEFQHTRDFSRKLNATFEFIRQNFKPLAKSLLYLAGPSVLVASVMAGLFMGEFFNISLTMQGDPERFAQNFTSPAFWLQMLLMMIFFVISYVVSLATINSYVVLYDEKKSNQIEVSEVWSRVQKMFWPYLGTSIILFGVFIVLYIMLLIPIALVSQISGVLLFFGILFVIGLIIFLAVSSSLIYFIQSYEKKGFADAIVRSYRLVNNGKWWSTFGLVAVLTVIVIVISYIFMIPYYAVTLASLFHDVSEKTVAEPSQGYVALTLVFFTLYYMIQMLLYALPNVGIAFQYFNLVELREAKGLMEKINSMGQESNSSNRPEEHF